jgi:site-specific DNA-methyltransferase (adenine-specific)
MMETIYKKGKIEYLSGDCFEWLEARKASSVHGVVTDPPFGLEYTERELKARRDGNKSGVWRLPPAFDGYSRNPLPRFTVLSQKDLKEIQNMFSEWGELLMPALVPGAHVLIASNPLVSHVVADAMDEVGMERRGTVIRMVRTMRGGDRPKGAHEEYSEVSVIPKALYEPWLLFRKPLDGTIKDNLERWWTGGLRRPDSERPFEDVIASGRAPERERAVAPHWSLKPQAFLRQVVRAILPLGKGTLLDTYAGSGSTLAAAASLDYRAVGVELSPDVAAMANIAIPALQAMSLTNGNGNDSANRRPKLPDPSALP